MKLENLNKEIEQYFKILSKEFPEFLYDYIYTPEMQRISKIGCACGTDYTNIFNNKFFYSNLEHSIGVALIVWNFTKDKKQTLAGLFHDIATPTFKHCIDFMNGDAKTQESTEAETEEIIRNSKEIMSLLKRDGITLDEVKDYHIYPIADNDTPQLSADRLEYTFTNGIYFKEVWDTKTIQRIYNNIEIMKNEQQIEELGFKNVEIANEFIKGASQLWPMWISNEDKLTMQFIADVIKQMNKKGLIQKEDLYKLSEQEVITKIETCGDEQIQVAFKNFRQTNKVYGSEELVKDKYCVSIDAKRRYIIPLVKINGQVKRINEISQEAKQLIDDYKNYKTTKYAYVDFNF